VDLERIVGGGVIGQVIDKEGRKEEGKVCYDLNIGSEPELKAVKRLGGHYLLGLVVSFRYSPPEERIYL